MRRCSASSFELAKSLVETGPIPEEYFEDALHIAVAAVNGIHYAIYSTLLIINKQSLFHLAGSLLHPILIPHQNSYIKCVQNFRDIQLSPNQHFKIKVSPLARPSLFSEALEPKFATLLHSWRYHHLIKPFMKTPGNVHQLAGSGDGLMRGDGNRTVEVRVRAGSNRPNDLQTGGLFPFGGAA